MSQSKPSIVAMLRNLNSRNLLNIGLFIFILVLVSLVTLEPGKEKKPAPILLTTLEQSEISHIEVHRDNEKDIQLEKRDGVWYITAPYQLAANDFRAQSITALATMKSHLQYQVDKIDLKKFKLDKPEVTVSLNNDTVLEVGGLDPLRNRRYVRNGDTLHLVNDTFYYQIIGKITAYISYQILPPDIKLSKLELPKFTLSQQAGIWSMTPPDKDVSADSINEFVNEWRHAQSLEISDYHGKLGRNKIRVYQKGQAEPLIFNLQKLNDDSVFLIRSDLSLRYKLSDEIADKLQNLPESPTPEEISADVDAGTDKKAVE